MSQKTEMNTIQDQSIDYKTVTIVCVVGEIYRALLRFSSHALLTDSSGGPGVGKGTQCTRLAADLRLVHISVGELLREVALQNSSNRDANVQIEAVMRNASLVSYHYVRDALDACLIQHIQHGKINFLVDGFPRSMEQAQFFDRGESIFFQLRLFITEEVIEELTVIADLESQVDSSLSLLGRYYARANDEESEDVWKSGRHNRDFSKKIH